MREKATDKSRRSVSSFMHHPFSLRLLGLVAIIGLALAMLSSGRIAVSRILVKYGETYVDSAAVESAIGMTPKDAEAHFVRGALSNYLDEPAAALPELELAVSLRPRDYSIWMELGMTRDQLGDPAGALFCLSEAVRLAPYYARPRWQRGNVLFRSRRYDEAFADFRQVVTSDPDFLPSFLDLAWGAARNDPKVTEQIVQVQGSKATFILALFFTKHGKADEAIALLRSVAAIPPENRREMVRELLAAGALSQAFELWSGSPGPTHPGRGKVSDGGFEGVLNLDEVGFGWRLARTAPGVSFSLDTTQAQTGARSLRIDFAGNTNPGAPLLSQLILLEPEAPAAHYKVNFWARTKDIVTGGLPVITVTALGAVNGQGLLGSSRPLPANTGGWQAFSVEFTTNAAMQAITIGLQREDCTSSPCPIFGLLNLDGFSLERVK